MSCSNDGEAELPTPTITNYSVPGALTGTNITISGTNFGESVSDVTVHFFDSAEASIVSVTNTALTVTVPVDAYVGPIVVSVKGKEVIGTTFYVLTFCSNGMGGLVLCDRNPPINA